MEMTTLSEELQQLSSWKEEVNEVRNEVKLMRERLEQIALSDAPKDVMAKVEHFENRLLRQREVADEMFHDLKQCAKKLSDQPVNVVHHDPPICSFETMQLRMDTFQQLYMELKNEFNRFIPGNESM
ncbi:hypothetical protein SAMN05660909_02685 [Chitinophaga terrae (ex Kim and Jung 2007)]|uniref:Uncharacterized protein n=1 Tax=Chitinophaga terrae (ex Kim and Jung 2007) TaxID=408074 RepID=A0A1H4CPE9_9BACT|nr:hypothetical protein [Chitinophaga terrae (ex Kim and Jung 2007)]MDQ0105160.1 hypothetical protein [Chitinophaga terrae (ex Kim and Jung 2007)]GEP90350.1 hypothetical protein CTE07_19950 [Chitinophaga terrae (ex Kim and Jung 2007)]SEA61972.1 hypothetical protein SAMN05660909_02685 [Chitinophaga terrae (ex Kim and Jung 2007)]